MKKILALVLAGTLFVSSSICVLAQDSSSTDSSLEEGSLSPIAEEIKKEVDSLKQQIEAQNKLLSSQAAQIASLVSAVQASSTRVVYTPAPSSGTPVGNGSSSSNEIRTQQLIRNNAVSYGSNLIAQGGHVEINGGKSNVTFVLAAPDNATVNAANNLASSVRGTLLNCVNVGSGVAFNSAKVNFYMPGIVNGDNIAVYQIQNGNWVQLVTAEIRQDHVVVNLSKTGTLAFVRVPVLATVTR